MHCILDIFRNIFFGRDDEDDDDARSNERGSRRTSYYVPYGGYNDGAAAYRAEASQMRSPMLPYNSSMARPPQASSSPSSRASLSSEIPYTVTTASSDPVKRSTSVIPPPPPPSSRASPSSPLPSKDSTASPLQWKPPSTVTTAAAQPPSSKASPSSSSLSKPAVTVQASPSSSLSSRVPVVTPLPSSLHPSKPPSTVVAAAAAQPPSSKASPSSSSLSTKVPTAGPLRSKPVVTVQASPSSSLSSRVPAVTPLLSKPPSTIATAAPEPPSSKASLSSSFPSSKVPTADPLPSNPSVTVLVDIASLPPLKTLLSSIDSPFSSSLSSKIPLSPARPSPPKSPASRSSSQPETPNRVKQKDPLSRYDIPEHLQELIKNDIVPPVLKISLSQQNYAQYFSTLLYAEEYEIEKWSDFLLHEVTLESLRKEEFFKDSRQGTTMTKKNQKKNQNDEHPFVVFEVDSVPERRPYLLSRDYVFVKPSGRKNTEPFKGVIFRVVKSTRVLGDFGRDFHKQHSPTKKYDVSFSFNRVCLKRAHVAISAATDPLLCKIIFPTPGPRTDSSICQVPLPINRSTKYQLLQRILNLKGLVPYLIEGPLVQRGFGDDVSVTGVIIQEAIHQIYLTSFKCKILVCAQRNRTCDALMRGLFNVIPKTKLFRANAAFRELDLVPDDIMKTSMYEGECFTCPPLDELQKFEIVTSTFMSSFRLHNAGIGANHFTHIFLVDASSAMEPETTVALANLVSEKTVVVIAGSSGDVPLWVRSRMARRKNGLRRSLFHRLLEQEPYCYNDPMYISHIS